MLPFFILGFVACLMEKNAMTRQNGFSLIELLIVVAIILIIAGIAIPNMLRARVAANEASAVSSIRTITTAQITYKITYPEIGYAAEIKNLGPSDTPSSTQAGLLPAALADEPHQHSGYTFSSTGTASGFSVGAAPVSSTTGVRSFCSDTPGVIYYSNGVCVSGASGTHVLP